MKIKSKNKKGFTLIEMMIVVAIIGILAVAALAAVNQLRKRSTATQVKQTATEIVTAFEAASLDGINQLKGLNGVTTTTGKFNVTDQAGSTTYLNQISLPAGCSSGAGCQIQNDVLTTGNYAFAIGPLKGNNWWYCTAAGGCRCVKGTATGATTTDTSTPDSACNSA